MTIKELEAKTGMERANIRFYEREGLLSPRRLENGYRDYSEEEAELLLRVRLLRSLHVPLDEIKAMRDGSLSLSTALAQQQERLMQEERDAAYAGKVCRAIREDGVSFGHLDAKKYLDGMQRGEEEKPSAYLETAVKEDTLPQAFYPWRRFLARMLDLSIYGVCWTLVQIFVFHVNIANRGVFFSLLDSYVGYGLMLLLEPLMLHFLGWTPGKLLLGLRLEGENGRLELRDAYARTLEMFGSGMGYGIPGYAQYCEWKAYQRCSENERQPWDVSNNFEIAYHAVERVSTLQGLGYACAHLAVFAVTMLAMFLQLLPPNRGELNIAQFAENYNYYADYLGLDFGEYYFSEEGQWAERPEDGVYYIHVIEQPKLEYQYTLSDGYLTGVSFSMDVQGQQQLISINDTEMLLAALSYAGAQKGFLSSGMPWQLQEVISEKAADGFWLSKCGLDIRCTVDKRGYTSSLRNGLAVYTDIDDPERYFSQQFSIVKQQ